jgi:hypothetical protein
MTSNPYHRYDIDWENECTVENEHGGRVDWEELEEAIGLISELLYAVQDFVGSRPGCGCGKVRASDLLAFKAAKEFIER